MKLLCVVALGMCAVNACARDVSQAFVPRLLKSTTEMVKKPVEWAKERKQAKRGMQVELHLSPDPLTLAGTRQIQATLMLTNYDKSLVQFQFPTSQRIEVVVRGPQGNAVVQWSDDQSFATEQGYVTINPGEHVEYKAVLPTRDLQVGQLYTIEAFLPKYPHLRAQRLVTPK